MFGSKKEPDMFIISNGSKSWVEKSSSLYLPKTHEFLNDHKITIISARDLCFDDYPDQYQLWKIEAFKTLVKDHHINLAILTNLISIGDSNLEKEAATLFAKQFKKVVLKTVKFRDNPRPTELIKQMEIFTASCINIIDLAKTSTITMERQ